MVEPMIIRQEMVTNGEGSKAMLTSQIDQTNVLKARQTSYKHLFSASETKKYAKKCIELGIPFVNHVRGRANFNMRGAYYHNFSFTIPTFTKAKAAVVALDFVDFRNKDKAVNMKYDLIWYNEYVATSNEVVVTGQVYVGDSDGYLEGIGFNCAIEY